MPDTPVERTPPGPYDPGLDGRVTRLEAGMTGVQADIAGIRTDLAYMRGRLEELSSLKGDVAAIKSKLEDLSFIKGQLQNLPTTWAMIIAIVGGQVALAGLLLAAVRLSGAHF